MSRYGRTFIFSCYVAAYRCAIIIQIMCYAVKVAKLSHYIQNFKRQISTIAKKFFYLLGRFQEKYQRAKNNSVQPGQNFQNPLPTKLVGSLNPHFCPNWTEVKKPTSTQVVSKSKSLLRNLQRSLTVTSTQVVQKLNLHHRRKALTVKS